MTNLETIKMLRERTGASLQACKKAIDESNGDVEKAIEILRKKGEAKAASRSERETGEGVVAVVMGEGKAAILKLSCETDFVAKNDDFVQAAESLAKAFLENGETYDASETIQALNLKMGEKVELGEVNVIEAPVLGDYVHSTRKVGALVALEGGDTEKAKDVAMHVTAMKPLVKDPSEISDEMVKKEKEIWREQLASEGKPAEIMEKIMMGKEKKFREENALLKQAFVKNPEVTVEQYLDGASIKTFVRLGQ